MTCKGFPKWVVASIPHARRLDLRTKKSLDLSGRIVSGSHIAEHARSRCYGTQSFEKDISNAIKLVRVSDEVQEAVHFQKPVVALESTIYTHGFPHPDNVALAQDLEAIVRECGGVPATIGVIRGEAIVGLSSEQIVDLASSAGRPETMKVSRRDLPYIMGLGLAGRKINGGTTVAATMLLASIANIPIFATGGLGGVHRGGQDTMDVSADLTELARTDVAVVGSGCKSFLDIPRTLEYLETQGVPVLTFADGRDGVVDFPAFWSRESGIRSPAVVQDEKDAAYMIFAMKCGNRVDRNGLLFANPIPQEFSIPKERMDLAIDEAIREANEKGHTGNANTPFILAKIKDLTQGSSIPANRALIESNVRRATKVAVEYSKIVGGKGTVGQSQPTRQHSNNGLTQSNILVAGSVAMDLSCDYEPLTKSGDLEPALNTSNPSIMSQSIGGVAHNIATAAHLMGHNTVRLCSVVAEDLAGKTIIANLEERGMDTSGIKILSSTSNINGFSPRTSQYVSINTTSKDLHIAMADMSIISNSPLDDIPAIVESSKPKWLVVDANWSVAGLHKWIEATRDTDIKTAFEPVSVEKSMRIIDEISILIKQDSSQKNIVFPGHCVDLTTPNKHELDAMFMALTSSSEMINHPEYRFILSTLGLSMDNLSNSASLDKIAITPHSSLHEAIAPLIESPHSVPQKALALLPYIPTILTKVGSNGILLTMLLQRTSPLLTDATQDPHIIFRASDKSSIVGGVYARVVPVPWFPASEDVKSVNGMGDTLLGVLVAGLAQGIPLGVDLVSLAQRAATETMCSKEAVAPQLGELLGAQMHKLRGSRGPEQT